MPTWTFAYEENWPLRSILCFLFPRKSFKTDMLYRFNFKMRSLCYTLSNDLHISRNTPRTSYPTSQDLYISWVIDRSWLIHESLGLKQDWFGEIRLFLLKKLYILFYNKYFYAQHFYCRSDVMSLGNYF